MAPTGRLRSDIQLECISRFLHIKKKSNYINSMLIKTKLPKYCSSSMTFRMQTSKASGDISNTHVLKAPTPGFWLVKSYYLCLTWYLGNLSMLMVLLRSCLKMLLGYAHWKSPITHISYSFFFLGHIACGISSQTRNQSLTPCLGSAVLTMGNLLLLFRELFL